MKSLFKLSALGILTTMIITGCTNHSLLKPTEKDQVVIINQVSPEGIGQKIGTITLKDTSFGLVLITDLSHLPPGPHGFHIHEKGSCAPAEKDGKMGAALAAGSHFNPDNSEHGNSTHGHLGDLPILNVAEDGTAKASLVAQRIKLDDIQNLAIMIHEGGDNFSDQPVPLGGGGNRIACGVIK